MLQYDNSAFSFFALSLLGCFLVPAWYSILSTAWNSTYFSKKCPDSDNQNSNYKNSAPIKSKATTAKHGSTGAIHQQRQRSGKSFLIFLSITCCLTLVFFWLLMSILKDRNGIGQAPNEAFDPFAILGIGRDTELDRKKISQLYKKLAIIHHPDKNRNNPDYDPEVFISIEKAHKTLTDEKMYRNWLDHGDPYGRRGMIDFGIGLPAFLIDGEYRNLVLFSYLWLVVFAVPFGVYSYYSRSRNFGPNDIRYDTYSWYYHALADDTPVHHLVEILAGSAEFRECNRPKCAEDRDSVRVLTSQLKSRMPKPKYNHPVCMVGNALLHTHLLRRTDLLNERQIENLAYMLGRSSALLDAMVSVCQQQNYMNTASRCIELKQYLTQTILPPAPSRSAVSPESSPLLQLPHFTEEEVKHCKKGKRSVKSVQQYRDLSDGHSKGTANFTDGQKKDVVHFLDAIYPDFSVETKVFVDDDDDSRIYENDFVTLQVAVTRNNDLEEPGDKAGGAVHAPYFPFPRVESLWVVLGQVNSGRVLSIDKVSSQNRKKMVHNIKFVAPPKGLYAFDLLVKSSDYVGCDYQGKIEFECLDSATLPAYVPHPEDKNLDSEPTLWEEMMSSGGNIEEEDSDDDSDEEEDEGSKGRDSANQMARARLVKARQLDDDDE